MTEFNLKLNEVQSKANKYEREFENCPQAVCAAFKDVFGFPSKDVIKAGTGMGGGIGLSRNSCGALIGGSMVISYKKGRKYNNLEQEPPIKTFSMVKELCDKFESKYDSVKCSSIQEKIMGESFDLWDKKEYIEFEEAGGHKDKCPSVCGKTAKWTAEILRSEGYL